MRATDISGRRKTHEETERIGVPMLQARQWPLLLERHGLSAFICGGRVAVADGWTNCARRQALPR